MVPSSSTFNNLLILLLVIAQAGLVEHTIITFILHIPSRRPIYQTTFTMPSIRQVLGAMAVGMVAVATALPAQPKISPMMRRAWDAGVAARKNLLESRQNPTTGLPDGLTDVDILELYVRSKHYMGSS